MSTWPVAQRILDEISPRLFRLPLYAFLPLRGTSEAICRVRQHCEQVRQIFIDHKFSIHQRASNRQFPSAAGGLLLSLDLTKAFDYVVRSKLFAALRQLGVSNEMINFLTHIYTDTSFVFTHRGQERFVHTFQGIRQGCKAAPILWACFSAVILESAEHQFGTEWLRQVVTTYADDFCLHFQFRSPTDLGP